MTQMMDCSSLFLVLHTKVAQICIQVYPPVHGSSWSQWENPPKWSGMKTHLVGSSVDSSCSSLAPSLSLQQASSAPQTIHAILSTYNHCQNFTILSSSPAKKLYYHQKSLTVDVGLFDFMNIGGVDERVHRLPGQVVRRVVQQVANPED